MFKEARITLPLFSRDKSSRCDGWFFPGRERPLLRWSIENSIWLNV